MRQLPTLSRTQDCHLLKQTPLPAVPAVHKPKTTYQCPKSGKCAMVSQLIITTSQSAVSYIEAKRDAQWNGKKINIKRNLKNQFTKQKQCLEGSNNFKYNECALGLLQALHHHHHHHHHHYPHRHYKLYRLYSRPPQKCCTLAKTWHIPTELLHNAYPIL